MFSGFTTLDGWADSISSIAVTILDAVTPVGTTDGSGVVAMGGATGAVLNTVTPVSPADAVSIRFLHRDG